MFLHVVGISGVRSGNNHPDRGKGFSGNRRRKGLSIAGSGYHLVKKERGSGSVRAYPRDGAYIKKHGGRLATHEKCAKRLRNRMGDFPMCNAEDSP